MPSNKIEMKFEDAAQRARDFLAMYGPGDAVIAGSIRRQKPIVHDIDILYRTPLSPALLRQDLAAKIVKWGEKMASIVYCGVPFDLYFSTPETFNTLLLIRTGSVQNNIRLASIAKYKGWKLHSSGEGLFNEKGERIAGDSERSIYDALGEKWQEPWERE
jgi:DNA polymerase/3'-5' exonuclease PolX